jgi:hypothetical protein
MTGRIDHRVIALLAKRREPAIGFFATEQPKSLSRIGGLPSLPASIEWPQHSVTGRSLNFLAQIDMASLPATPLPGSRDGEVLPRTGMLFFFFSMTADAESDQRVVYAEAPGPEREAPQDLPYFAEDDTSKPDNSDKVYPEIAHLEAHAIDTFWGYEPGAESVWADKSVFEADVVDEATAASVRRVLGRDASIEFMLFGASLQQWPENLIARKEGRIYFGEFFLHRYGEFNPQFWIRPDDLKALRFEHAWSTMDFT